MLLRSLLDRFLDGDGINHRIDRGGIDPAWRGNLPAGNLHAETGPNEGAVAVIRWRRHDIGVEFEPAIGTDPEHVTATTAARPGCDTVAADRHQINLARNQDDRFGAAADGADHFRAAHRDGGVSGKHTHIARVGLGDLARDEAEGSLLDHHPDTASIAARIEDEFVKDEARAFADREGCSIAKKDLRPHAFTGDNLVLVIDLVADGQCAHRAVGGAHGAGTDRTV